MSGGKLTDDGHCLPPLTTFLHSEPTPKLDPVAAAAATKDIKERLEEMVKERSDRFDEMFVDEARIRLGEAGWKDRYYHEKLKVPTGSSQQRILHSIVQAYTEGLCWVMKYYYEGVASWRW